MRCVAVVGHVFVCWAVMRLMNFWPVRLLMLRRAYIVAWFGPIRLVVVAMLRLVVLVSGIMALGTAVVFALMILGATVMVVIVPVLCVRTGACS